MKSKIVNLTDDNFHEYVIESRKLILVDFWAEWCNPCKVLAPIFEEISSEYEEKLFFAKLNIEENPVTAPNYGIRGIPALLLFKDGKVQATKVGSLSKIKLKEFLDTNLI